MVTTTSCKVKALRKALDTQRRCQKKAVALLTAMVGGVVTMQVHSSFCKTLMHASILTGESWVKELLAGHPVRFHRSMGMAKHVFWKLIRELQVYGGLSGMEHVTVHEQLAIFVHIAVTGSSNRQLQERFQRSGDTISK
jgi:hypothetical protein